LKSLLQFDAERRFQSFTPFRELFGGSPTVSMHPLHSPLSDLVNDAGSDATIDPAIEFKGADSKSTGSFENELNKWYGEISPRYVDLVSDFAGQEFFLLDGEALVQSVFNDPMLDLGESKGGMHF
jgi:hypothetical protein